MALDNDKESKVIIELQRLNMQIERLISDFESEKEVRRRIIGDIEQRIRKLEAWRADMHGRLVVTISVASAIGGIIIALIIKLIQKL